MRLAHHDRRGRCPEAHDDAFSPLSACLRKPAAMLAAVGAVKIASMWSLAGADDAHVATARLFAIDRPVELDTEAHDAVGPGRRPGRGDRVAADHVVVEGASWG